VDTIQTTEHNTNKNKNYLDVASILKIKEEQAEEEEQQQQQQQKYDESSRTDC
jgi:hypothetical protein